jgi:hypothetical protein
MFHEDTLRVAATALIVVDLVFVSLTWPKVAVVLALGFLMAMGMVRRMFIPLSGSTTYDPILLVGATTAMVLAFRLFVIDRHRVVTDRLSGVITLLLIVTVLEAFNPASGNPAAGAIGLLFVAAPLVWFFIGRELADAKTLRAAIGLALISASIAACYGLFQTYIGLPPWDAAWLQQLQGAGQYVALNVGGVIRPWGPFASAAEYATVLSVGLVVGVTKVLHGRLISLVVLPLLGFALFIESSRGSVILAVVALVVIAAMRARTAAIGIAVIAVTAGAALAAQQLLAANVTAISLAAISVSNPLVGHQLGGLANPFDPTQSTAGIHLTLVVQAILGSVNHPFGLGTAATNLAGAHAGLQAASSEFDVSDVFTSLGPVGGVLYVSVIAMAFVCAGRVYHRRRNVMFAAALGVLVVCFGQWLNGGYYAASSLVWFLLGACDREALIITADESQQHEAPEAGRGDFRRGTSARAPAPPLAAPS